MAGDARGGPVGDLLVAHPRIHTPDQRLRVFVSSTLHELADERLAVQRAIETLRLTPVMFELGARPYPPRALYRAYLEQSHVFLGIYWQSYGWVAPEEEISGLEDEYLLSGDRPRLVYVRRRRRTGTSVSTTCSDASRPTTRRRTATSPARTSSSSS